MSYLARLKRQISPDAPKVEATKVSKAPSVPFVAPVAVPLRDISEDWREFESLLAIVGPAYIVTEAEYELIRDAAMRDLENALYSYRQMAEQIERNR